MATAAAAMAAETTTRDDSLQKIYGLLLNNKEQHGELSAAQDQIIYDIFQHIPLVSERLLQSRLSCNSSLGAMLEGIARRALHKNQSDEVASVMRCVAQDLLAQEAPTASRETRIAELLKLLSFCTVEGETALYINRHVAATIQELKIPIDAFADNQRIMIKSVGSQLRYLCLNLDKQSLTPEGLRILAQRCPHVTSLTLRSNGTMMLSEKKLAALSAFKELRYLTLKDISIPTLPPIELAETLETLRIINCALRELPRWVGDLPNLIHLDVSDNNLENAIQLRPEEALCKAEELSIFPKLQHLNYNGNNLKTLPSWMQRLTTLRWLGVIENDIKSLPDWLWPTGSS